MTDNFEQVALFEAQTANVVKPSLNNCEFYWDFKWGQLLFVTHYKNCMLNKAFSPCYLALRCFGIVIYFYFFFGVIIACTSSKLNNECGSSTINHNHNNMFRTIFGSIAIVVSLLIYIFYSCFIGWQYLTLFDYIDQYKKCCFCYKFIINPISTVIYPLLLPCIGSLQMFGLFHLDLLNGGGWFNWLDIPQCIKIFTS